VRNLLGDGDLDPAGVPEGQMSRISMFGRVGALLALDQLNGWDIPCSSTGNATHCLDLGVAGDTEPQTIRAAPAVVGLTGEPVAMWADLALLEGGA
jgi:hypothetical protein